MPSTPPTGSSPKGSGGTSPSKDSKESKDTNGTKDTKDPKKPKEYEQIDELSLHENVGGGKSSNTSVSVLQGVVRIERADDKDESYRIVAAFQLQVKIHAFEKGYLKTADRLFDSISLRYLYEEDEIHEILPGGDALTTGVEVTEESANTTSTTAGLQGTALSTPAITPSLSVQVGREKRLTVKREIDAWRSGVSYESWYQRKPNGSKRHGEYHGEYHGDGSTVRHKRHHHAFLVQSAHKGGKREEPCKCPHRFNFDPSKCKLRESAYYSRCVHWFWQVQAQPHLWTPEIYESVTFLITVTRIVDPKKFCSSEDAQRYLHFDFIVKTRLRELGHTLRDCFNPWRPWRPAEMRTKTDWGRPLGVEKVRFCIRACPEGIHWPGKPTPILQELAYRRVYGPKVSSRLQPNPEGKGKSGPDSGTRKKEPDADQLREQMEAKMEARLHNLEDHIAVDSLKREIEALKDTLASNPGTRRGEYPCRDASPCRHHHHRHPHRDDDHHHRRGAALGHHTPDEQYEYDTYTTYQRERSPAPYRYCRRPESDPDSETVAAAILRGRSRERRPYSMSGAVPAPPTRHDPEEGDGWMHVRSRSTYRSPPGRVRERSFTRTRALSVDARRWRARSISASSSSSCSPNRECRCPPVRDMRQEEWEARQARRIHELEERVHAHEAETKKREEEAREKEERDKLRRQKEEHEEAEAREREKRSNAPTSSRFRPGEGIVPGSEPIELVDHDEEGTGPDGKTPAHRHGHHHRSGHKRGNTWFLGGRRGHK